MKIIPFDFETTGSHPGCRPVELAAVRCDETGVLDIFETLIDPECPITVEAVQTHGITQEMVAGAPTFPDACGAFLDWLGDDRVMLAHYAPFDCSVLQWNAAFHGISIPSDLTVIDTCAIARGLKRTSDNKLETLVNHYQLERAGAAHRALSDAMAAMAYYSIIADDPEADTKPYLWDSYWRYGYPETLPAILEDLPDLVRDGRPMTFRYADKRGDETERTLTPWGWATQGGQVNVHGWCHLREEKRQFRADRIVARMAEAA